MTREEEILGYCGECNYKPFSTEACTAIKAIEWADQNPRKGLVDIEKACTYLESVFKHLSGYYSGAGYTDAFRKAMVEED